MPKVLKMRSLLFFAISLENYGGWSSFLPSDKREGFLQVDSITLSVGSQGSPKNPKQKVYIVTFGVSQGKLEGWSWFFACR